MRANIDSVNIEHMISQLRLAKDVKELAQVFLWAVAKELEASQGAFFITKKKSEGNVLGFLVGYAYHLAETETLEFEFGEGLSGQVAKEGKLININKVPEGYLSVLSGLGQATPSAMIIFPLKINNEVLAVVELASFKTFLKEDEDFLLEVSTKIEPLLEAFIAGA
jgi:putative methionine-R-sulfoxide reductase with GAF domain